MKAIPLYDPELAKSITETGKRIVREMMAKLENYEAVSVVNATGAASKSDDASR